MLRPLFWLPLRTSSMMSQWANIQYSKRRRADSFVLNSLKVHTEYEPLPLAVIICPRTPAANKPSM